MLVCQKTEKSSIQLNLLKRHCMPSVVWIFQQRLGMTKDAQSVPGFGGQLGDVVHSGEVTAYGEA